MKSCSTCGIWKSDAAFYHDRRPRRSTDGRHHSCKDCERLAARERMRALYHARKAQRTVACPT